MQILSLRPTLFVSVFVQIRRDTIDNPKGPIADWIYEPPVLLLLLFTCRKSIKGRKIDGIDRRDWERWEGGEVGRPNCRDVVIKNVKAGKVIRDNGKR